MLQTSTSARIEPAELARAQQVVANISRSFDAKVVGQSRLRESLLVGLMTGGHILLESVPGLAKTTAAQTVAESVSAEFRRIQCTPDLLPSDIVGTQIYDAAKGTFITQLGPVHANIVLLDEINRSSAKTQSAMLEAMQERQTSIGGQEYKLPSPFLVLATQNPIEQEGTYALPEAQLDRFLLKVKIDYPTQADELAMVKHVTEGKVGDRLEVDAVQSLVKPSTVVSLQAITASLAADDVVLEYAMRLVRATRTWAGVIAGAGPRGAIALVRAARAAALLAGRDYVTPDDVKKMALPTLRHRVVPSPELELEGRDTDAILKGLLEKTEAPRK